MSKLKIAAGVIIALAFLFRKTISDIIEASLIVFVLCSILAAVFFGIKYLGGI